MLASTRGASRTPPPTRGLLLQIRRAEAVGQQVAEGGHDVIVLVFRHNDGQFRPAELIERLAADARRGQ